MSPRKRKPRTVHTSSASITSHCISSVLDIETNESENSNCNEDNEFEWLSEGISSASDSPFSQFRDIETQTASNQIIENTTSDINCTNTPINDDKEKL